MTYLFLNFYNYFQIVHSFYLCSMKKMAARGGHSPGLGDRRPRPVSALHTKLSHYFLHVTFSSKKVTIHNQRAETKAISHNGIFFFKSRLPKSITQSIYFILFSRCPEVGTVVMECRHGGPSPETG